MVDVVDIIEPHVAGTIPALFDERVRRSGDRVAYRQFDAAAGRWSSWTWTEIGRLVARWRAGLKGAGLAFGDRVAILRRNSVEWVCFDQAALGLGLVVVPLYASDSPRNHADALADTEPRLLLVDDDAQWSALAPFRSRFPGLTMVIRVSAAGAEKPESVSLSDWLPATEAGPDPSVSPGTLASITFTSGTTDRPRGVMLTHANLVFAATATLRRVAGRTDDVFLSFLPLAHILERTAGYYAPLACGAELAFARSVQSLADDLQTIRPTVLIAVPRIYERAWQRVQEMLAGSQIGRALLRWPGLSGDGGRFVSTVVRPFLMSRLIGPRLRARFGGRIRVAASGAAPLPVEICKGLRAAGLPLTEGYGLTEATGPVSAEFPGQYVPGSVGRPLDGVDLRAADSGEILVRSPGVMAGYWRRPKETAETVDAEGWLHTGDLGKIENGRLTILGRIRDTIVMSTGEKVSPSGVEARIVADPLFEQAVVLGDRRPYLVALVVLSGTLWRSFAESHRCDPQALSSEETGRLLVTRMADLTTDLPRHAQIRRVWPVTVPWTVEDGLITVTLKPKREALARHFAAEIERLYQVPQHRRTAVDPTHVG